MLTCVVITGTGLLPHHQLTTLQENGAGGERAGWESSARVGWRGGCSHSVVTASNDVAILIDNTEFATRTKVAPRTAHPSCLPSTA